MTCEGTRGRNIMKFGVTVDVTILSSMNRKRKGALRTDRVIATFVISAYSEREKHQKRTQR